MIHKGLYLILAMDRNRLIGANNDLPWRLPADLKYFKKTTTGHPIIMGRKTYESIGKPLPNRQNIVLTRDPAYQIPGVIVVQTLDEAIQKADNPVKFVIGGAAIYNMALPVAERLYITEIDEEFSGDTYFSNFSMADWQLVSSEEGEVNENNPYKHRFLIYERKQGGK